jgi:hypothetical protein
MIEIISVIISFFFWKLVIELVVEEIGNRKH